MCIPPSCPPWPPRANHVLTALTNNQKHVPSSLEAYVTFLAAPRPQRNLSEAWLALSAYPGRDGRPLKRSAPPYPPSTVERALAGIRYIHGLIALDKGLDVNPFANLALRETLKGIRRRDAAGQGRH